MSSGIKVDPASPSNLDYNQNNDNHSGGKEGETNSAPTRQDPLIDRSKPEQESSKSLDMRKARKKKKKKKITQRRTREHDQNND